MKRIVLCLLGLLSFLGKTTGQVTQINNNNSLQVVAPIANNRTILNSVIDSSLWVTDGTLAGTLKISDSIKFLNNYGILGNKMVFNGFTASSGSEIFITDGTSAGTSLVKDINSGAVGSDPGPMVPFNGILYFSAVTAAQGRELWKTDGTSGGTVLVKDIVAGSGSSNSRDSFNLFSSGSYLLFDAQSAAAGIELWKSDGTASGTAMLKDINTGNSGMDSSNPRAFFNLNGTILFYATDATHGEELWKTDGTSSGTVLVKDINPGSGSSGSYSYFGFQIPLSLGFHNFQNKAYFTAYDGTSTGELWSTDGTAANTFLVKTIVSGVNPSFIGSIDAVNLPSKFIFPVSDGSSRSELWVSDGSSAGTSLFQSFSPATPGELPIMFPPIAIDFTNGTYNQTLFKGNKFFFAAGTSASGYELYVSDGTLSGTNMVKDINPGAADGIDIGNNLSFLYTSNLLFFAATDGTHGNELWQTDGTPAGTSMVYDINPGTGDAKPDLPFFLCNGKVIFGANDGNSTTLTDLFVLSSSFGVVPVTLMNFRAILKNQDGWLSWETAQEFQSESFTIERSLDGIEFDVIAQVPALGSSNEVHQYDYKDPLITSLGSAWVFYRIREKDLDGSNMASEIARIAISASNSFDIFVLGNPVSRDIRLRFTGVTSPVEILIKSLDGKIVYANRTAPINGPLSLGVNLDSGVWILEAKMGAQRKVITLVR